MFTTSTSIWRDYRRFRRNFLAIFELEKRFAADIYEAGVRTAGRPPLTLDVAFLVQACRALEDAAEEARSGLRAILSALSPGGKVDSETVLEAAKRQFPDLDDRTHRAVVEHFTRNGGPEGLLATLDEQLGRRVRRYRAGASALRRARATSGAGLEAAQAAVFPPRSQSAEPSAGAEAETGRELARAFADATLRAKEAVQRGEAYAVAMAEREVLAARLLAHDPVIASTFGISPGPVGEPEPLLCLIFGYGWAVCVVVLLIAASNHNVEGEDDDGDTTGG